MQDPKEGNVLTVQIPDSPQGTERAPLFLIHDGGGTIFNYFLLGTLGRRVYGIPNPRFETGSSWKDGIPQMARCYSHLIQSTVRTGAVLLGGWSLGGLVALEIARTLSENTDSRIVGVLLIDSYHPQAFPDFSALARNAKLDVESVARRGVQGRAQTSLEEARRVIQAWKMDEWQHTNRERTSASENAQRGFKPPSAILIRATKSTPFTANSSGVEVPSEMSGDAMHGWSHLGVPLVERVYDVQAHHFDMFDAPHINELTNLVRQACDSLEKYRAT